MNNYDVYRDRVDISLEKYEAMRDEIIRLENERANFEHKYENLKSFIDRAHLPGEIIADGKLTKRIINFTLEMRLLQSKV